MERSTFSDIFETLSKGTSIDAALERALRVTPRSKLGNHDVRFPAEPSPFTTPRPTVRHRFASPTPQSFSEIFQPRPPLVLREHSSEQLKQLTTTERMDKGEESSKETAMSTLRAILDHVKKKEEVFEEDESEYDYEYVYDYVEVDNNREQKSFTTTKPPMKKRPKIVPKQRIVHPKVTNNRREDKFSSFVTPGSIQLGKPDVFYNAVEDSVDIINPPIFIEEAPSTRRIGYNYNQPQTKLNLPSKPKTSYRIPGKLATEDTNFGSAYMDETPDEPLTPSLQSYQVPTSTPSSFSGIFEGVAYNEQIPEEPLTPSLQSVYSQPTTDNSDNTYTDTINGAPYNDQTPEEPLTPSLQSAYEIPTKPPPAISNKRNKFGYKYSAPDDQKLDYNKPNQVSL